MKESGMAAADNNHLLDAPYVPMAIHYEDADTLEYVQRDVPTVSRLVQTGLDVLLDLDTREPIGWRIYGWSRITQPADDNHKALVGAGTEALSFLRSIEGSGYGGMSVYDCACFGLEQALAAAQPLQQAASAAASPNTTPLERVARAITDNIAPELHDQIAFGYCARAALQALREVDEWALEAMFRGFSFQKSAGEALTDAFTAAIDHILSQGGEG